MLTIKNLTIYAGETQLLEIPDLTFYPGQITTIVGESGSGKTLTFRALAQLSAPELQVSGQITYDGLDIADLSAEDLRTFRQESLFVIFQDAFASFSPSTKVGQQLYQFCEPQGARSQTAFVKRLTPILEDLGLLKTVLDQYPYQLSGGMLQRTFLAIGIYRQAPWLLADEPTSGVDLDTQSQFLDLLVEMRKRDGQSTVLITHDIDVVRQVADRVVVMLDGQVVEVASKDQIFESSQHHYTRQLLLSSFKKWEDAHG